MVKYRLLITNDDGPESPLLQSFLDALSQEPWCKELRVVVPYEEQSWVAQATTRYRPIYASEHSFGPHRGYLVSGTPADCVSLGIDSLFPDRPDVVFSGINMGENTGLAFHLNSGTVGGARQAFLGGVNSAAFSVRIPTSVYQSWSNLDLSTLEQYQSDWRRLASISVQIAGRLIKQSSWSHADLFSINIPWEAQESTDILLTRLERRYYGPLFRCRERQEFIHDLQGYTTDSSDNDPALTEDTDAPQGDISALRRGLISVTPVKYGLEASRSEHLESLCSKLCSVESTE